MENWLGWGGKWLCWSRAGCNMIFSFLCNYKRKQLLPGYVSITVAERWFTMLKFPISSLLLQQCNFPTPSAFRINDCWEHPHLLDGSQVSDTHNRTLPPTEHLSFKNQKNYDTLCRCRTLDLKNTASASDYDICMIFVSGWGEGGKRCGKYWWTSFKPLPGFWIARFKTIQNSWKLSDCETVCRPSENGNSY